MVLLAAEGCSTPSTAREVGVRPRIASNWRWRFADQGLDGLEDRPRAGKKPIASGTYFVIHQCKETTAPHAKSREAGSKAVEFAQGADDRRDMVYGRDAVSIDPNTKQSRVASGTSIGLVVVSDIDDIGRLLVYRHAA
jgi:transposase